jgi:hypothetical protein
VRDVLLTSSPGAGAETESQVLLAEVLALRAVVINLLFSVSQGERLTVEQMQGLIERADTGKAAKAAKLLSRKGGAMS